MTVEYIKKFLANSGLKNKVLHEQIGVPQYVIGHFFCGITTLSHNQMDKLEKFINDFISNNEYVNM